MTTRVEWYEDNTPDQPILWQLAYTVGEVNLILTQAENVLRIRMTEKAAVHLLLELRAALQDLNAEDISSNE